SIAILNRYSRLISPFVYSVYKADFIGKYQTEKLALFNNRASIYLRRNDSLKIDLLKKVFIVHFKNQYTQSIPQKARVRSCWYTSFIYQYLVTENKLNSVNELDIYKKIKYNFGGILRDKIL